MSEANPPTPTSSVANRMTGNIKNVGNKVILGIYLGAKMSSRKIVHVCILDKFIPQFIDFVEQHFTMDKHEFRIFDYIEKYPIKKRNNIIVAGKGRLNQFKAYVQLVFAMHKAEKIILHSLFNHRVTQILWAMPWLLKKCYWIMWGGDLYVYLLGERNKVWKRKEFFRRPVIKNMGYLLNGTTGDVVLAREWYGAKGRHIKSFNYTSNIYKPYAVKEKSHSIINIQIGNSAEPSNHHFEILDKLSVYKHDDIKLYAPLSYGNKEYADRVIVKGKEIFGDKFVGITEFMAFDKYLDFLAGIDIAIFNHRRQQAFGNMITLLGLGKKVFIHNESTLNGVFQEFGITIYDTENIDLELIDKNVQKQNIERIIQEFSKESLVKSLKLWIE